MICTRSWLGLSLLDDTEEIVPGRAVAARWPGQPAFMVVSAYLATGKGLDKENLLILEKIGQAAARAGLPVILGADFSMPPDELVKSDFVQRMHAVVVGGEHSTKRARPGKQAGLLRCRRRAGQVSQGGSGQPRSCFPSSPPS